MINHYTEQLTDPRWDKVRRRVIERDEGKCVQCGGIDGLNVHHSHYRPGRAPWEYRDSDLFTLCGAHHRKVHGVPEINHVENEDNPLENMKEMAKRLREMRYKNTEDPEILTAREELNSLMDKIRKSSGEDPVTTFEQLVDCKRRIEELERERRNPGLITIRDKG